MDIVSSVAKHLPSRFASVRPPDAVAWPSLGYRIRGKIGRTLVAVARRAYWRLRLGSGLECAAGVSFGPRLSMSTFGTGKISFGSGLYIAENVHVESRGTLSIGPGGFIGHGATIAASQSVHIGDYCLIAEYVTIRDNNHAFGDLTRPMIAQGLNVAPVVIESDVWIGAKATIVAGVHIGAGSIIGANAVVTHDLPPGSIAVGVPARVIRQRTEPGDEKRAR